MRSAIGLKLQLRQDFELRHQRLVFDFARVHLNIKICVVLPQALQLFLCIYLCVWVWVWVSVWVRFI